MSKTSDARTFDKVEFYRVEDNGNALKLADKLLFGIPLCLDFRDCPRDDANEVITFLSGVIYSLDGSAKKIQGDIFLFARKIDYRDGSLKEFIDRYKL